MEKKKIVNVTIIQGYTNIQEYINILGMSKEMLEEA